MILGVHHTALAVPKLEDAWPSTVTKLGLRLL